MEHCRNKLTKPTLRIPEAHALMRLERPMNEGSSIAVSMLAAATTQSRISGLSARGATSH
jgi:hypothetical protein